MPKRLQRKRNLGWRKPENAVIVDRTSRWGNPFKKYGDMIYCDASHRRKIFDPWVFYSGPHSDEYIQKRLVDLYRMWIQGRDFNGKVRPFKYSQAEIKEKLFGKDLICFCPLDQPCHAEVLLEIANRRPSHE